MADTPPNQQNALKCPKFQWSFLCPRYWGIWLGLFSLRLLSFLPYRTKFNVGAFLGRLLFTIAPARRRLAEVNLALAFPGKTPEQIHQLAKAHFESLGIGLMETGINLWGRHRHHQDDESCHFHFEGVQHLQSTENQGTLLLVPHFTTLEMTGLMLSYLTPFRPIYRPHDNPLMEYLITQSRTTRTLHNHRQFAVTPIPNTDTRGMIKELKNHHRLMILPDQRYRAQGSIDVPFFEHPAPSNPGINKLSRLGKAKVLPIFTERKGHEYYLRIQPPLENFPSGDDYADTLRLHKLYETEIRKNPTQYLWTHNRWDFRKGRDYS